MKSMPSSQMSFIPQSKQHRFFGGSLLVGRRKSRRPINTKDAIHVVLKSQFGRGVYSFRQRRNLKVIHRILINTAQKKGVRIYRLSIQSNHIHLIIKVPSKMSYRHFMAIISGKIASHVMCKMSFKNFIKTLSLESSEGRGEGQNGLVKPKNGLVKSKSGLVKPQKGQAFWDHRPFTRLLHWGKDFVMTMKYVLKNTHEARGFVCYSPRQKNYAYQDILNKIKINTV